MKITNNSIRTAGVFGSRQSATQNNFSMFNSGGFVADFGTYTSNRYIFPNSSIAHTIGVSKDGYFYDGAKVKDVAAVNDFTTVTTALICNVGSNNYTGAFYDMKIYSVKIDDNEMRPALVNGKPCLYDTKRKIALYNQGTGEFLYGEE